MRTTALLLAAVIAAAFVAESFSAPTCDDGATYVKSSKASSASKSNTASSDSSSEEIKISGNGEFSKKASQDSKKSASKSAEQSSESLEYYKAGAAPCGDALPARKCGESDEVYYKRIFPVNECDKSTYKCFYAKVFKQYKGETDKEYISRIDFIFDKVYSKLDCRTDVNYKEYVIKYYSYKYSKNSGETDEAYFKRTITKGTSETEEKYNNRITIMKYVFPKYNWKIVKIDAKSKTGYTLVKETSTSTGKSVDDSCGCKKTITKEEVKKTYAKKSGEEDTVYYKRIFTKSESQTTEQYIQVLTYAHELFVKDNVWYDEKYLSYTKTFYTAVYSKKSCETEEAYYKRILTKETYETSDQWAKRSGLLIVLFPNLKCWSDVKYYTTTKTIFEVFYKKTTTENENTYYKRITTKYAGETNECYTGRVTLVKNTLSCLDVWYEARFLSFTKTYYYCAYAQQTKETEDKYFERIMTKTVGETDDQCAKRAEVIRNIYPNLKIYYEKDLYEKYSKKIYTVVCKKVANEDDTTLFKRITQQTETEKDTVYAERIERVKTAYPSYAVFYEFKYFEFIKKAYTTTYSKGSSESQEVYYKRLVAKESCDTSDVIQAKRTYLVHLCTVSESLWYDEKYYEKYTKTYYSTFYKKAEKEECVTWLTRIAKPLPKESDCNCINRIKMINKSKTGCKCWTSENLKKLECDKSFTKELLALLKKEFITSASSLKIKKSSSASNSKTASASSDSSEISVKNC